jgi:hypothetical protein
LALADALKHNNRLCTLILGENNITAEAREAFSTLICLNYCENAGEMLKKCLICFQVGESAGEMLTIVYRKCR